MSMVLIVAEKSRKTRGEHVRIVVSPVALVNDTIATEVAAGYQKNADVKAGETYKVSTDIPVFNTIAEFNERVVVSAKADAMAKIASLKIDPAILATLMVTEKVTA